MDADSSRIGALLLIVFIIAIVGGVLYALHRNEPKGTIVPLYDSNGTPVLDRQGNQMYVDEYGKVIGHRQAMKYYEKQENPEGCGCLSLIALSFLFSLFK